VPTYALFVIPFALTIPLVFWGIRSYQAKQQVRKAALERLGFFPCPDRKTWIEETITAIENMPKFTHQVREPRKLIGSSEVYYYHATSHSDANEETTWKEEVLFAHPRPSRAALMLFVKPTALKTGWATRLLTKVVTMPWDARPADLEKIDIPAELQNSNLFAALGPPGARLYDLIDPRALTTLLAVGDVGALSITCRDAWCTISGGSPPKGFELRDLLARIRPLL
jgi:hypothetical protein